MSTNEETNRLYSILEADAASPAILEGLKEFSAGAKNEVVARIVRTREPSARVLARLLSIITEDNRENVTKILIDNLQSHHPEARKASLYGLDRLGHPGAANFAVSSLQDGDDQVVAMACSILLPKAKQDPRLWEMLRQLYAAKKGKPEFHMSMSLLEAHAVDN